MIGFIGIFLKVTPSVLLLFWQFAKQHLKLQPRTDCFLSFLNVNSGAGTVTAVWTSRGIVVGRRRTIDERRNGWWDEVEDESCGSEELEDWDEGNKSEMESDGVDEVADDWLDGEAR